MCRVAHKNWDILHALRKVRRSSNPSVLETIIASIIAVHGDGVDAEHWVYVFNMNCLNLQDLKMTDHEQRK